MLELEDFKHLPVEIRSALRRMLPDPVTIRQGWSRMTPDEKQDAIQHISGFIPQPRPPPPQYRPPYENRVAPKLEPIAETPVITEEPEAPIPVPEPIKKGFLNPVEKGKKKDAKNKKENEVIALGAVGADVSSDETPRGADGFLGRDE